MLTAERLREVLRYEPETGEWFWRVRSAIRCPIGSKAGNLDKSTGYNRVKVDGHNYRACRLVFLYMTGKWPAEHVDHIDTNRADDRWVNLREANRSQNKANGKRYKNNTTGFKGAYYDKRVGRYWAYANRDGKKISLGYYDTPGEAHAAYLVKTREMHGEFARAE